LTQVNESQARAIQSDGHVLVVSTAGSGKTRVMVSRAAYLLRKDPKAPIVITTFTRDAANELRSRLRGMLGRMPQTVLIGTFHSLAMELLRRASGRFRLLSPGEQAMLLRRAYARIDADFDWEEAGPIIDHYKSTTEPVLRNTPACDLYRAYQTLLTEHHAMDFSDPILESVRRMRDGTAKPLPCLHILVDEFQDVDEVQFAWMDGHIAAGARGYVVGDDDQSIYGFRHALGFRGMQDFEKRYGAATLSLNENYRSASTILEAADRLIRHNRQRMPKQLRAARLAAGTVRMERFCSRLDEAEAVLAAVRDDPGQWAVVARTNRLLDLVEAILDRAEIPNIRSGTSRLWDRRHVASLIASLRALAKGESHGIEQLFVSCGVDEKIIADLGPITIETAESFVALLPVDDRRVPNELVGYLKEWKKLISEGRAPIVIEGVAAWYMRFLRREDRRSEDLAIAARTLAGMDGSIIARLAITHAPKRQNTKGSVSLLTMHATKGLEYPCLWLMAFEEDIIPHLDAIGPDGGGIEEERRLAYVGMTRARETLVFSTGRDDAVPSRFLREAGILDTGLALTA